MKNAWYFCCLSGMILIFNGLYVSQYAIQNGGASGRGSIDFQQRQKQQTATQSIISTYEIRQNYYLPS
jgi:hypothetical protein